MTSPFASYVLCGTPRSGSTLLCEMLAATGVAGRPNSYFRQEDVEAWADAWGVPHLQGIEDPGFDRDYPGVAGPRPGRHEGGARHDGAVVGRGKPPLDRTVPAGAGCIGLTNLDWRIQVRKNARRLGSPFRCQRPRKGQAKAWAAAVLSRLVLGASACGKP
jgi:hypothetical protein